MICNRAQDATVVRPFFLELDAVCPYPKEGGFTGQGHHALYCTSCNPVVCTGAAAHVRPVTHVVGLLQVPLLASLNAAQRSDLCTALQPRIFNAGESIVRKGEPGEAFYIVESGTCTVLGDSDQVIALHLMLHHVPVDRKEKKRKETLCLSASCSCICCIWPGACTSPHAFQSPLLTLQLNLFLRS